MKLRVFTVITLCGLAVAAAYAQSPMYRSVMPDGKVVYSDKPVPGAKESKQVNLAPLNIATPPQAPDTAQQPPAATTEPINKEARVAAARQKLDAAQKALDAGREPGEGDRIGVAKGGGATSRFSDSYLERVKQLEDAVAAAQKEFDEAQRAAR